MPTSHRKLRLRRSRGKRSLRPLLESLEVRLTLSVAPHLNFREFHDPSRIPAGLTPSAMGILPQVNGLPFPIGYTPDQLRTAYGISNITFGTVTGDGTGQTIAIVDAYDNPSFVNSSDTVNYPNSDLAQFDLQLGIADPPSFTKVNESGATSPLPGVDPAGAGNVNGNWEIEEALDIEWAHAMAPGAHIVVVEATSDSNADLFKAVATAASLPGVSAVSMSWGLNEFSGQTTQDSTFVTPSGHQGVTFLAASGDAWGFSYGSNGQPTTTPGILYPAASPNVVGVGGTTLQLNADDSYNSETAWSGSGGGTSLYETQPAFQKGAQSTGKRTVPDVAFNADPNTGVAVYDSYNNTDHSGPWVEVGGTSLSAPAWAGLIAIANQGRVLAGATTLDGPSQTLPALYAIPATDYNDITSGGNGVFSAGPGYDEVTGLGSPKASLLVADLSTFGTASQIAVSAQPPSSVIAGDGFGVVVAAENPAGGIDPAFNGSLTISIASNPGGSTLGGTLTVNASRGVAVFDGLTLDKPGKGYTLKITSSSFPSITTKAFNVITNPTPWQGTYYPAPTDASLRAAIKAADNNSFAYNTIVLSASSYLLSNTGAGGIVISNPTTLPSKSLTILGQGQASTIIGSVFNWHDRIFEIEGSGGYSLSVAFDNLTIEGGKALDGGIVAGSAALGGGLLIDNAAVTLTNVLMRNNQAQGALGAAGAAAKLGAQGGKGGDGKTAQGGGIYLASGSLSLFGDTFSKNFARGGKGGTGGAGGGQGTKSAPAITGGKGGTGGIGGNAAGGGIYAAGGAVVLANDSFSSNQAAGGPGGNGGTAGSGGHGSGGTKPGKPGGAGGLGGNGGAASAGGIYLAAGTLTISASTIKNNTAAGGAGGQGGAGGPGTAVVGSITGIFGGSGSILSGLGGFGKGGPGGNGGNGGSGAAAAGGGLFVGGGSLTLLNATIAGNQALGGNGGIGGRGGTGGFGGATKSGLPVGQKAGNGGSGGPGGSGSGGGINVSGGTVVLSGDTLSSNVAQGGQGGTGGLGGYGPLAALGSGITTGGGGTGGTGGTGGGGTTANSAGAGGNGGNGATGSGGGLYVSGGTLTLTNDTIAANPANAGAAGTGGAGGKAGTGQVTGGMGGAGGSGSSFGGGLFVNGGLVNLDNSTIALNSQNGAGYGGGVVQSAGTVTAASTIFAGNGTVDFSGDITATDCLFQTKPVGGTVSGSGNLTGVDPLLDTKGLQNNGGPTQTIALQTGSPAFGAGTNPEKLFTDQRGHAPRTGPSGTDIGAYQHDAGTDTQAPTTSLKATNVTASNAASLTPYPFTITYSDNVAAAAATLTGALIDVVPPGQSAPIPASVVSIAPVGTVDADGNAQSFVVTYDITPPGGSWTSADNGTYTVTLGGSPVTDLAGNAAATGKVGTFTVSVGASLPNVAVASSLPGSTYGQSVSFTVTVSSGGPTPTGTVQFLVDGTDFGSAVTLAGGTATSPSTTLLGAGKHTIEADYSGDSNYSANNGSYTQVVNQAPLTLVADDQSMNHYDTVPALTYHYTGFVNGDNQSNSGIVASVSLSTTGTSSSPAGYYPITPTVSSFSAPNYYVLAGTQDGTLTVKPKVMDVMVDFGGKSMSLLGLTRDLPFINIKTLDVIFSDNVVVSSSMLNLTGVNVKNYTFSGFNYNATTFDATWTLASAIGADRLTLGLSGEAAPPVSGSGANIGADPFNDQFNVLPGDVNGDGVVTISDAILVRNEIASGSYLIWDDIDGNGVVNIADLNGVRKRLGTHLP